MRLLQDMLSNLMRGNMGLSAFGRKHVSISAQSHNRRSKPCCQPLERYPRSSMRRTCLNVIEALDDEELAALLAHLLDTHDINAQALAKAATNMPSPRRGGIEIIANQPNPDGWNFSAAECNTNGTVRLVHFRKRLLD